MKTAFVVFAFSLAAVGAVEDLRAADRTVPLFNIQRIENANELVYEARLTAEGFPAKDPIKVYWVMKAKDGHLEDLTALEKQRAYGVAVEKVTATEVVFTLRAFKGRKIVVRRMGEAGSFRAKAFTLINDEDTELDRLYVTTSSLGFIPVVAKVEIFGRPKADGSVEKETFIP